MIKAHCMGTEFPKRDTDGPNVKWALPDVSSSVVWYDAQGNLWEMRGIVKRCLNRKPSAADLDAVAEEQRVKEKTGLYYDKDGWYPPS